VQTVLSALNRRRFLKYIGSAAAIVGASALGLDYLLIHANQITTNQTTTTSTQLPLTTVNHFEDRKISFDYPSDWSTLSKISPGHDEALNVDEVTGVGLPRSPVSVRIYDRGLPTGSNLRRVYDETYSNTWISQYVKSYTIAESIITVDGVTAYERVYKRPHGEPWYQIRDIWLEKEGRIYVLSCWASPDSFHVK
jgi:hypothetical protein